MMTSYGHNTTPTRRTGQRPRLTPSLLTTPSKQLMHSSSSVARSSSRRLYGSPCRASSSSLHQGSSKTHTPAPKTLSFTPSKNQTPSVANDRLNKSDRFIPSRQHMNIELSRRCLLQTPTPGEKKRSIEHNEKEETPLQKEFKRRMLSTLCNIPLEQLGEDAEPTGILSFGGSEVMSNRKQQNNENCYSRCSTIRPTNPFTLDVLRSMKVGSGTDNDASTQQSVVASKVLRKVPSAPVRILDAPDIVDDYYLNLISWSKDNILAVALARSVYLWNATTGDIQHLISVEGSDYITSVCWSTEPGQTKYVAVGTFLMELHLFDGQALQKVRTMKGACGRIASISWSHQFLSAGDRDGAILNHDVRAEQSVVSKYRGHNQEVCGLKWNDEGTCLASGGNENYLCLWDAAMSGRNGYGRRAVETQSDGLAPRLVLKQHKAAVKALDWCPFHRGLLASGGGTADRTIKFWNSSSGALLNSIDTGSQVCSLIWSRHQREICSSHGYSENQLILWKYPTMTKIKELTGHTSRVLNMDISPDGTSIVSAGGDETLRFWNIFGTPSTRSTSGLGELLSMGGRVVR